MVVSNYYTQMEPKGEKRHYTDLQSRLSQGNGEIFQSFPPIYLVYSRRSLLFLITSIPLILVDGEKTLSHGSIGVLPRSELAVATNVATSIIVMELGPSYLLLKY